MRRVLGQRVRRDRRNPFGKHIAKRRALLDAQRVMMRVAGQTGGRLAGDEKFGELRMPLVKLNVVGRNSPNKIESFFIVLEACGKEWG